ncbi:hypothetical protein AZA_90498 [Nitrospirillum viridazoti Y2]|nr:hypothetical protein AZA_90498 [Nitrospirillum amazonense Y2]
MGRGFPRHPGGGAGGTTACAYRPRRRPVCSAGEPAGWGQGHRQSGGQHPGAGRAAGRVDGQGRRTGDRAVPPVAGRGIQQRRRGEGDRRGDRAPGARAAGHHHGCPHGAHRVPVRAFPPAGPRLGQRAGQAHRTGDSG